MSFTALGNFQHGYLDRVLGKGGILSTAKRIDYMLSIQSKKNAKNGILPNMGAGGVVGSKYRMELWNLIARRGHVYKGEQELIKRLLQQVEINVYSNLDDDLKTKAIEYFESDPILSKAKEK